jgi:long-subunit acyl-CoA synthetase (AMP-forming)
MLGYWNDPESTSERIQDGWLDTGDIAEFDESQNVCILGRNDDTIILENGYKIDPLGIEQLICGIKGVRDCALMPSAQSGYDAVVLCEENRDSSWKADIEGELRELLSKHLVLSPRRIFLTTEDWSESNGLRNFKGAKNRSQIKKWISENRGNL